MIDVRHLSKAFRGLQALSGVSFTARDGEITGLIGPNGAGKTTSLRILYTALRADAGRARVDGFDAATQPREVQRRIGVLPDARGLYPRLTAREHIRYFGRLHGLPSDALEARCDDLIDRLGMADIADRRAKGFSRGQSLKVALARALVHEPRNLILDEPTNGLDIGAGRAVRQLIAELRDAGRCILLSSHIMAEVEALCDRLVVIAGGRVVASGTPDELRRRTGCAALEDVFLQSIGGPEAGLGSAA